MDIRATGRDGYAGNTLFPQEAVKGVKIKTILHENKRLAKTAKLSGVSLTRLFFMSIAMKDIHRIKEIFMENTVEYRECRLFIVCGEMK